MNTSALAQYLHLRSWPDSWRYPREARRRDERIDLLRGLAMLAVIINHVALRSLYHILSVEAIGVVSAAEGFVVLSGVVVGLVYHERIQRFGIARAQTDLWRRAGQIYLVALVTNLLVYGLQWLPLIDPSVLISYTDPVTGTVYSLYGENPTWFDLLSGLLLLRYGPGQINVLGLYVALLAVTPLLFRLLQQQRAVLLIGLSWLLYAAAHLYPIEVLPSQSENAFPILAWQVLYVHGVLAGYYRDRLSALLRSGVGRVLLIPALGLFLLAAFFALNNPWYDIPGPARFRLIGESTYYWIYANFFQRTVLGLGRVINIFLVIAVFYLLLTYCWLPCRRLIGWLCIPLGQASLYIFVVHLLYVLIVANIPALQTGNLLLNTLAHSLVIAAIWLMVRTRLFFRLIPR